MDKERLRIPSDSSSGSSSRGGASPNLSTFRNNNSTFLLTSNNIGPPPNSPAGFSPLLPSSSHSLPPPPGLPHPGFGGMYPFPPCPGYQNISYPLGVPPVNANQSPVGPHYPSVSGVGVNTPYELNGYPVQNCMMQTQASTPPPGYNNFYGTHRQPSQAISPNCFLQPNHMQTSGPLSASQRGIYNQSGDSSDADLEKRINLLLSSTKSQGGAYENNVNFGSDFLTSHAGSYQDETINVGPMPFNHLSKETKQSQNNNLGGVMNPIIENLVGSMSMCNGTYTHFGPSNAQSNKIVADSNDLFGEQNFVERQNGNLEPEKRVLNSKFVVAPINKEQKDAMKESIIFNTCNIGRKHPIQQIKDPASNASHDHKVITSNASFTSSEKITTEARASSPRESAETLSRPQTPGKPSYLEVLTKAGGGKTPTNISSTRKASSTSSSPVQSAFSVSSDSVPNLSHRKSVDYFVGATTSSPASSCPSASSSPATKPRNFLAGMILKGKENVSSASSNFHPKQANNLKNPTSNSPTHVNANSQFTKAKVQAAASGSGERKVLSSQNSSGSSKSSKSGGVKNGKISTEKPEELGETNRNVDGDWGWKTYTSRGRNNNLNSVGNKNSQKRTSTGSCESDAGTPNLVSVDDDDEDADIKRNSLGEDAVAERKSNSLGSGSSASSTSASYSRNKREKEKEKPRNRKEDRNWRNCVSRRLESIVYIWLTHMISALTWLWSLVTDVASLSASLGVSLIQDFYLWTKTKAVPNFTEKFARWRKDIRQCFYEWWCKWKSKILSFFGREAQKHTSTEDGSPKGSPRGEENILSLLGPDRNINLPANGDEALKRLLSVKGQDPYSILGVRSDSSDETIRRYYKRQAVLVHPDKNLIVGAEEAFKILARAFEMVGDPIKRTEYHQKLMEAQAKEKFCGEIGNLLEQLRKKMEAASSTIRCTKCNSRHKKNITDRPLFAARYCSQCKIHHGAREGELWAERSDWFGLTWNYFACMDAHIWEINEWARCQKTNLKHIKADAHCVMYRLVAGGNNHQNHQNQHCHGSGAAFEEGAGSEADEWDSLINNLSSFGKSSAGVPGKTGCCASGGVNSANGAAGQAAGKRRKGKRNK